MRKTIAFIGIITLCLTYLAFEFFYNHYAMLSVDEFWFAHRIYQFLHGLPYRDFAPYKTVLGYYILLWPFTVFHSAITPLFFTKDFIAIINTLLFFISACWLTRFFKSISVLIALAIILFSETMLSYSTNIRVDLLAYWCCLFSVLCLLEKRYFFAGILLGLGFLISQKVLWYIVASNTALVISMAIAYRPRSLCKTIAIFNSSIVMTVSLYIFLWSMVSDLNTVLRSVFYEAYILYQLDWYDSARHLFWKTILSLNPLPHLLWPVAFLSLWPIQKNEKNYQIRLFSISFASVILVCLIPFKQVFPYYMVVTLPAFLLLYSAFFSWLIDLFQQKKNRALSTAEKIWFNLFLLLYVSGLCFVLFYFSLPSTYLFLAIIPGVVIFYLTTSKDSAHAWVPSATFFLVIFFGLFYPLLLITASLPNKNNAYQLASLRLLHQLLPHSNQYIAGIELMYDQDQPILGLRHLMGPAIDYLYAPKEKLKPIMLASLYESPEATSDQVIAALKNTNIKLYVNNYRMYYLPPKIKTILASQYQHYWGSIYLYAPEVAQGLQTITIKFDGNYRVDSQLPIYLNKKIFQPSAFVFLKSGIYQSDAGKKYRLILVPAIFHSNEYQQDEWVKMLA